MKTLGIDAEITSNPPLHCAVDSRDSDANQPSNDFFSQLSRTFVEPFFINWSQTPVNSNMWPCVIDSALLISMQINAMEG